MQSFQEKVKELLGQIHAIEQDEKLKAERKLPSDCYFLNSDTVLSYRRDDGDARYPYAYDGLTLWAYASGNVKMEESVFSVFLPTFEAKEPYLAFFAGKKQENGYFPISLLGTAKQAFEKGVKRYTVFTPQAAYYFTETDEFTSVVRMLVDDKKLLRLSVYLENTSGKPLDTYVSTYINFFIMQTNYETFETKWYKRCKTTDYGYLMSTTEYWGKDANFEHYAAISRSSFNGVIDKTTSHSVYTGSMHNQLSASTALINGKFAKQKAYTEFTETAVAGDIIPLTLGAKETFAISYTAAFYDDKEKAVTMSTENRETAGIDEFIARKVEEEKTKDKRERMPKITFSDIPEKNLRADSVNYFFENVTRQVEFCTRAKNYAGSLIGIRDIFQQVEAALTWIPDYCRKKIVEALGYIGDDGRAPRQYSYPLSENVLPRMDLRPYIDQGVWIISTVYTYLRFTGDYSILDEVCGYYKLDGYKVDFSAEKDTVLEHLLRIAKYLLSKLADDTGCLRILYGDWNDALDGLGAATEAGKDFGDGVSVMATLQLYQNLGELCDILKTTGKYTEKIAELKSYKETIQKGLQKYAIDQNADGARKIVHGWGDKLSYKIGSYCDNDGINRDGLTSNAFWILSGAIGWDESLKEDILNAYDRLDSKYGLKTFEPYFPLDNMEVGRITHLPEGTAENGATYIHATLFAIWSLFEIGEAEKAWGQLYKILPLTHEFISTTPFIMSNSYLYNEERGFDGESMSDWFTGSGCVLVKTLLWEIFGVQPDLNGLTVRPANYFPSEKACLSMQVKGCDITVEYKKTGEGKRRFTVNGIERNSAYDPKTKTQTVYFTNEELANGALSIFVTE